MAPSGAWRVGGDTMCRGSGPHGSRVVRAETGGMRAVKAVAHFPIPASTRGSEMRAAGAHFVSKAQAEWQGITAKATDRISLLCKDGYERMANGETEDGGRVRKSPR